MSPQIPSKKPSSSSTAVSSSRHKKPRRHLEPTPNPSSSFSAADSSKPSDPTAISRTPPPLSPAPLDGLERRPIVLLDGSVRYYYALPPDFSAGTSLVTEEEDYWSYLGLDGQRGPPPPKRKDGDGYAWLRESVRRYGNPNAEAELDRHRESVRRYGNPNVEIEAARASEEYDRHKEIVRRYGNPNVDAHDRFEVQERERLEGSDEARILKEAFLRCSKLINETLAERSTYLEDGKNKPLRCIVCGRTSKTFVDMHDLVVHACTSEIPEIRLDHLGLHKALCVLMGWDYSKAPDNSKAYQSLPSDEAAANREDLIVWPPTVIIHNTNTGRRRDGRMDGLSDKEVEVKLKELGFTGVSAKSLYGKGGHLGIAAVKFATNPAGLKEAERLAEYFKKEKHGREGWALVEASQAGTDEKNSAMSKEDKDSRDKKNDLYGYLASASDLEKVDIDTRKKAVIKSRKEFDPSD